MEEFENYSESLLSEFNEKRAYNELKSGMNSEERALSGFYSGAAAI